MSSPGAAQGQGGRRDDDAPCRRILQARDHYGAIGVPRGADEAAIKAEFRKRALEVHPDKNASRLASEAFKRLQQANEVLSDAAARRRYDTWGDAEPVRHRRAPAHDFYGEWHGSAPSTAFLPLLLPAVMSLMLALLMVQTPGLLTGGGLQQGPWPWPPGAGPQKRPQQEAPDAVTRLTVANADGACGSSAGRLCVVLLTKAQQGLGEREGKLLAKLRTEAMSVRNSRGQSLLLTWATTPAVGRWPSLLPPGATLPWVVVLKHSRVGLRAAALPVPAAGGRTKHRLSEGVPQLLQDVASGSAKFEALKGTVAGLFSR